MLIGSVTLVTVAPNLEKLTGNKGLSAEFQRFQSGHSWFHCTVPRLRLNTVAETV